MLKSGPDSIDTTRHQVSAKTSDPHLCSSNRLAASQIRHDRDSAHTMGDLKVVSEVPLTVTAVKVDKISTRTTTRGTLSRCLAIPITTTTYPFRAIAEVTTQEEVGEEVGEVPV